MNTQRFENSLFALEVKTGNGEPMFDVETVARSLGFTQVKNGKEFVRWERVNDYLKKYSPLVGKGDFISEPMVYKLAFKANNTLAEQFQDWLATEVLPTIRKHGAYLTEQKIDELVKNPDLLIQLATQLKEEQEAKRAVEEQVTVMQPKVDYYDRVLTSDGLMSITSIGKNYGMTAMKMNELLHEHGIQYYRGGVWNVYAKYQNEGYTQVVMIPQRNSKKTVPSMKWTPKGQEFIYNFLKDKGILPLSEQNREKQPNIIGVADRPKRLYDYPQSSDATLAYLTGV